MIWCNGCEQHQICSFDMLSPIRELNCQWLAKKSTNISHFGDEGVFCRSSYPQVESLLWNLAWQRVKWSSNLFRKCHIYELKTKTDYLTFKHTRQETGKVRMRKTRDTKTIKWWTRLFSGLSTSSYIDWGRTFVIMLPCVFTEYKLWNLFYRVPH